MDVPIGSGYVGLVARAPDEFERWLDKKELAAELTARGYKTTWATVEKLAQRGMPSVVNFGKRMYRLSEVIPWLRDEGIIERR